MCHTQGLFKKFAPTPRGGGPASPAFLQPQTPPPFICSRPMGIWRVTDFFSFGGANNWQKNVESKIVCFFLHNWQFFGRPVQVQFQPRTPAGGGSPSSLLSATQISQPLSWTPKKPGVRHFILFILFYFVKANTSREF